MYKTRGRKRKKEELKFSSVLEIFTVAHTAYAARDNDIGATKTDASERRKEGEMQRHRRDFPS